MTSSFIQPVLSLLQKPEDTESEEIAKQVDADIAAASGVPSREDEEITKQVDADIAAAQKPPEELDVFGEKKDTVTKGIEYLQSGIQGMIQSGEEDYPTVNELSKRLQEAGPNKFDTYDKDIVSTLTPKEVEKLLERQPWVYATLTPEQKAEQFKQSRESDISTLGAVGRAVGQVANFGLDLVKAGANYGWDQTYAEGIAPLLDVYNDQMPRNPITGKIKSLTGGPAQVKARERVSADLRNMAGAWANTVIESQRQIERYSGGTGEGYKFLTPSPQKISENVAKSPQAAAAVAMFPMLGPAAAFSPLFLSTKLAEAGKDPNSGYAAFIDQINERLGLQDELMSEKHFDNRKLYDAEKSAEDWNAGQGAELVSPWSKMAFSPVFQYLNLQRNAWMLPNAETYAKLKNISVEEAKDELANKADENAEKGLRSLADKMNKEYDPSMELLGSMAMGDAALDVAGIAVGGTRLLGKGISKFETAGMTPAQINALMTARQARQKEILAENIANAQKRSVIGGAAKKTEDFQKAALEKTTQTFEKLPTIVKEYGPGVLSQIGLGAAGGTAGYFLNPEDQVSGALKGLTITGAAGLTPGLLRSIDEARMLRAGGSPLEAGTFEIAGKLPTSSKTTKVLFGGKRGAAVDYLTDNLHTLGRAGVNFGAINAINSAINSDSPERFVDSVAEGIAMGVGFKMLGKIHGSDPEEELGNRKRKDVEIYLSRQRQSDATQSNMDELRNYQNYVDASQMNVDKMQGFLDQTQQEGDPEKIASAQKAVDVAQSVHNQILTANVQTRNEMGRMMDEIYADANSLLNGARKVGQQNVKLEILTTPQIVELLSKQFPDKSADELVFAANQKGFFIPETSTSVVNFDKIIRRQQMTGESLTDAFRHEALGHGLWSIKEFQDLNKNADDLLFERVTRDLRGNVVDVKPGKYTEDELFDMYSTHYLKGKSPEQINQYAQESGLWNNQTNSLDREKVINAMKDEIRAELIAGNLEQGFGKMKQQSRSIDDWVSLRAKTSLLARAMQNAAGIGAKPFESKLLGISYDPEVVAANRRAIEAMRNYNGEFEDAPETKKGVDIPEKTMRNDPAMRKRYGLSGGEYKTTLYAEVKDAEGNVVGQKVPVTSEDAKEGAWVNDASTGQVKQTKGYGQVPQEIDQVQVPSGGSLNVVRDFVYEPDGNTPVRRKDKDIEALDEDRRVALKNAIDSASDRYTDPRWMKSYSADGESYDGLFSPEQIKNIKNLPESVLPLSIKEKLIALNNLMLMGDGSTVEIDYAPRLKGKKYKGRRSEIYSLIPGGKFQLSKANNFTFNAVSRGAWLRKIKARKDRMPGWFNAWGNDTGLFEKELQEKYLANTYAKRPGWYGLDPENPTEKTPLAEEKWNKFKDFLDMVSKDVPTVDNPWRMKTPKAKGKEGRAEGDVDNLWRKFRLDAIADWADSTDATGRYTMGWENIYKQLLPTDEAGEPTEFKTPEQQRQGGISTKFMPAVSDAEYLDLAKDPKANQEQLQRMVDEVIVLSLVQKGDFVGYGIRKDSGFLKIGDNVKNSFVWEDGMQTDEELGGSSSVGLDPFTVNSEQVQQAIKRAKGYRGNMVLIAGDDFQGGEDIGEYIIADAKVIYDFSADPVTYDNAGNVIPLSQRFQTTSPDIRFMPERPAEQERIVSATYTDPKTIQKSLAEANARKKSALEIFNTKANEESFDSPEATRLYEEYDAIRKEVRDLEFQVRNPGATKLSLDQRDKYLSDLESLNEGVPTQIVEGLFGPRDTGRRWKKGKKIADSDALGDKFEAELTGGVLFRGVTKEDWERIQNQGYIDTDGRGVISQEEEINLATSVVTAETYIPHGKQGVVLAIDPAGLDLFMIGADDYLRASGRIPIDNVVKVSGPIGKDSETGTPFIPSETFTEMKPTIGEKTEISPKIDTEKLKISIDQPFDEFGDIDYDAEDAVRKIAKDRNLGITSDRELAFVAKDENGEIVGGAFTSADQDGYTFDVVVSKEAEGKGVGSKLLDEVINPPYEITEAYPDAKVKVDVVNPSMKKMLENRGFVVEEKIGKERWIMVPQEPTISEKPKSSEMIGADTIKPADIETSAKPANDAVIKPYSNALVSSAGLINFLPAYHGTPYDVDKFKLANIGTGEGAQAYGWGLYFAQKKGTATSYRDKLTPRDNYTIKGMTLDQLKDLIGSEASYHVWDSISFTSGNLKQAKESLARWKKELDLESPESVDKAIKFVKTLNENDIKEIKGNLYKVDLDVKDEDLLDWDKPLSEQSKKVQNALKSISGNWLWEDALSGKAGEQVGAALYSTLRATFPDAEFSRDRIDASKKASDTLLAAGIHGIRYLDGTSRKQGEGTYNYVIFDENLIKILDKNDKPVEGDLPKQSQPSGLQFMPAREVKLLQKSKEEKLKDTLKVRMTRKALTDAALSQKSWKDWYKEHQDVLDDFFGDHAELFQEILAVTSQAASVKANVGLALKAFGQLMRGEEFDARLHGEEKGGYLDGVINNLNAIKNKTAVSGRKISNYKAANEGDASRVVVDRHITRLLFGVDTPSKAQYDLAEKTLTKIANDIGWEPSQVQAALWAHSIVMSGKKPESYGAYLTKLESTKLTKRELASGLTGSQLTKRIGELAYAGAGGLESGKIRGRYSPISEVEISGVKQGGLQFMPQRPVGKTQTGYDYSYLDQALASGTDGRVALTRPIRADEALPLLSQRIPITEEVEKDSFDYTRPAEVVFYQHENKPVSFKFDPKLIEKPVFKDAAIEHAGKNVQLAMADRQTATGGDMGGIIFPWLKSNANAIITGNDGVNYRVVWGNNEWKPVLSMKKKNKQFDAYNLLTYLMGEDAHASNTREVRNISNEIENAQISREQKDLFLILANAGVKKQKRADQTKNIKTATKTIEKSKKAIEKTTDKDKIDKLNKKIQIQERAIKLAESKFNNFLESNEEELLKKIITKYKTSFTRFQNKTGSESSFKKNEKELIDFKKTKAFKDLIKSIQNKQLISLDNTFKGRKSSIEEILGLTIDGFNVNEIIDKTMDFKNGRVNQIVGSVELSRNQDLMAVYLGNDPKQARNMTAQEAKAAAQLKADPNFVPHEAYSWAMLGPVDGNNFLNSNPKTHLEYFSDFKEAYANAQADASKRQKILEGNETTLMGAMRDNTQMPLAMPAISGKK